LYPISILETRGDRVKIHYIGYGNEYDEWRKSNEIETSACSATDGYDLHSTLAGRIKATLNGQRKSSPRIRVVMPFDESTFNEGLGSKGYIHKPAKGISQYKLTHLRDLNELLGKGWHYRGINKAGDYSYVTPGTVRYRLYKRRSITHYVPNSNGQPMKSHIPQGHMLNFTFVRGNGTPSDFGTNPNVFWD